MFRKIFIRFVAILVIFLVSNFTSFQDSPASTLNPSTISQVTTWGQIEQIDIGGRKLAISCQGEGNPTVVFESGYRTTMACWKDVWKETAKYTRSCVYDRANLGQSDPATKPRTSKDIVDDLQNLLTNARIPGPYLLVGHSMGSFNVLIYANQYPQDVAGIVLVDPSHPDQFERWLAILPVENETQSEMLKICRQTLRESTSPSSANDPNNPEGWDWLQSAEELRSIHDLGELPLTVITAVNYSWLCYHPLAERANKIWQANQKEYLELSPNSQQIMVSSNHLVMESEPEVVVAAILDMLEKVK
jgi:pimeloyl-ACP methyl ester carboxylesterase